MTDLVTGTTGFIGSHLAERLLATGRTVRVLCRKESRGKLLPALVAKAEIAEGDLRDRDSLFHACGTVADPPVEQRRNPKRLVHRAEAGSHIVDIAADQFEGVTDAQRFG